jgi:pimeloyl-ACP methyl ester carboxylesterase
LALRELAISLSAAGHHVMRFDYRGTGDSSGDVSEMSVRDWTNDITSCVREGLEVSGATEVNLVGVRIGALLLCHALPTIEGVRKVVLWDGIYDGRSYVRMLSDIQRRLLARNPILGWAERKAAANEFAGQILSPQMIRDMKSIDFDVYKNLLVYPYDAIYTAEEYAPPDVVEKQTPMFFPCNWGTDSEAILMPKPVLEGLRECLVRR